MNAKREVKHRPKSTSGKYKTIYHLLETMFAKNRELTAEKAMIAVTREFPQSAYVKSDHFPWYKTHIVSRGEFRFVKRPAWATGVIAKIK